MNIPALAAVLLLALSSSSLAGEPPAPAAPAPVDWLLDPSPFKAQVKEDKARRELILNNGLARRTFLLTSNAACVSLENLVSQEHLIRAIAPEARVTLDGVEFCVGGLRGAPIANYLNAAWRESLVPIPNSYQFTSWEELPVKPRFGWKKRPEWLAKDLPWPPPGKHVVMHYAPPAAPPASLGGPVVADDDFVKINDAKLNPAWKVLAAPGFDRASFVNEGKVGEVMARQAAAVCAEREWPQGAESVEVLMDSGDDRSDAWGPGLAVVHAGGVTSLVTNPGAGSYSVKGKKAGKFDPARPCRLRVRWSAGQLFFEAAQGEAPFTLIDSMACAAAPKALRVGKPGLEGSGKDAGADKTVVRCHIHQVSFRGAEAAQAAVARRDLPGIEVHYEIYDGIPLLSKWLVVNNTGKDKIRLNRFTAEELRLAEVEACSGGEVDNERPNIWVETDYTFGGNMNPHSSNAGVSLVADPDYPTQMHYACQTPCLLKATPDKMGPEVDIKPGESFESFRVFGLLLDSSERERRTLAQRRMYRTVAPWTAQNPFMFHKLGSDPKTVRDAIDQAAEVGFEMVIMSFGSGFNFESRDPKYMAVYKELADYGKSKGIALGGYSLLASRGAATKEDNTQGQPATFGVMPCLGAQWGRDYLAQIKKMCETTGFAVFEHDGSYPGDRCAAKNHPHHHGLEDSQWVQWKAITGLYQWCTANGVYLNIPDWYFLAGGTKTAMHYRESNYGLPRNEQVLVERQNMFDGTWNKTASMGWMLIPLSSYNGGPASTIEPLDQHRDHYNERFADLIGYGVQACYRGPRLYDTEATKAIVKKWTAFYKAHREVLDGDIIHLRRPNGQDWDGIVHVNPQGQEKAMAFLYNPLAQEIEREIRIPLYYSGLKSSANVSIGGGPAHTLGLDKTETATVKVRIPAHSHQWLLFTETE
ncbi:MAG: hypothetical protein RL095_3241 [Verrucomicrobiota bacterium]|jgi:hypothetical protein